MTASNDLIRFLVWRGEARGGVTWRIRNQTKKKRGVLMATYVTNISMSPVQNISNFEKRRFEVKQANYKIKQSSGSIVGGGCVKQSSG